MVINMDETKLRTIAQSAGISGRNPGSIHGSPAGDVTLNATQHISRVLKRFDYPRRSKPSVAWC
jgi:hypothetical protein